MAKVTSQPILTGPEERALSRRALDGDARARDELVERNMRLVISIAKRYQFSGLPLEDLVAEGTIGMLKAVDRFDPELGFKLSTYATLWIRQAVQRYVHHNSQIIRVPTAVQDLRFKMGRHRKKYPDASDEELALELEVTIKEIEDVWVGPRVAMSLDSVFGFDGDSPFHDVLEDPNAPDPADVAEDMRALRRALAKLSDRERAVLELRWGLDDGKVRSRNDTARLMDMQPSSVATIQARAMKKLRKDLHLEDEDEAESKMDRDGSGLRPGSPEIAAEGNLLLSPDADPDPSTS